MLLWTAFFLPKVHFALPELCIFKFPRDTPINRDDYTFLIQVMIKARAAFKYYLPVNEMRIILIGEN